MEDFKLILNILEKYMTEGQKKYPFWTEHDVLGFNVDYEGISKEDAEVLKSLGVIFDDREYDSIYIFT